MPTLRIIDCTLIKVATLPWFAILSNNNVPRDAFSLSNLNPFLQKSLSFACSAPKPSPRKPCQGCSAPLEPHEGAPHPSNPCFVLLRSPQAPFTSQSESWIPYDPRYAPVIVCLISFQCCKFVPLKCSDPFTTIYMCC